MTQENRNKLNVVMMYLNKMGFKTEDIMLTGSLALDLMGILPEDRETHDVDFIIKMDDETWKCLKFLEAYCSPADREPYPGDRCLIFDAIGVKFNIWRATKSRWKTVIKDSESGIWVSPVKPILDAKKSYGRTKDYKDLNDICKSILK